ncbi:MAG: cytochrome P450 [Hyphomicrobium sp.]|nr:cytochrome P450 [Hyphomicrobium sp.]
MAVSADEFGGMKFPGGTTILIAPWALHRHCRLEPAPNVFRPERILPDNRAPILRRAHLPFVDGPRTCIGMRFCNAGSHCASIDDGE